jgi:PAS domain S-box-containing protein
MPASTAASASAAPELPSHDAGAPPFLATLPPSPGQRWAAAAAVGALALIAALTLPRLHTQLAPLRMLLPAYQAVMFLLALGTAWLLLAQARILRSRALLALSAAYLYSALMALLLGLSFPGLREGGGSWLARSTPQTTAWLFFLWHGGFALAIGGYALAPPPGSEVRAPTLGISQAALAWGLGTAAALACAAVATVGTAWLPPLMRGDSDLPAKLWAALGAFAAGLLGLVLLAWRRGTRSVLDLWLHVTLGAWLLATLLAGVLNHGRFDMGWYVGRLCSLLADATVLFALLLENSVLYARLADEHRREHAWSRQRLRDSEQRFRAVFDHATVAISVHDAGSATLLQANARALQACGGSLREAQAEAPHGAMRAFACAAPMAPILAAAAGPSRIEWRSQRSDGSDYWEEVLLTPVQIDGRPRVLAVASDITERKELQRQILEVSTAEQERIGREVHDGIGQQLTALTLLAGALQRRLLLAGHAPEAEALGQLQLHLEATLQQARALARGLAPVDIDRHDLPDALRELAARVRETTGLDCGYEGMPRVELPQAAQARHLFRIAQEAVANALRHAQATTLHIRLDAQDHGLVLQVLDDGLGVPDPVARRGRLGLHIMAYRADAMGARLYVRRRTAGGTEVRCVLPLLEQPPRNEGCADTDASLQ